jgi:hypothetical protein
MDLIGIEHYANIIGSRAAVEVAALVDDGTIWIEPSNLAHNKLNIIIILSLNHCKYSG